MPNGVASKGAAKTRVEKPKNSRGSAQSSIPETYLFIKRLAAIAVGLVFAASLFVPWFGGDTLIQIQRAADTLSWAGIIAALSVFASIASIVFAFIGSKTRRGQQHVMIGSFLTISLIIAVIWLSITSKGAFGYGLYLALAAAIGAALLGVWEQSDIFSRTARFVRESYIEVVKKAVWPTWPDLKKFTAIVIFAVIVVGIWIGVLDFAMTKLTKLIGLASK